MDEALSSGIVATVTSYETEYVRFAPSIRNTPEDIEAALRAMRAIA